ncbi:MAG: pirin family protein [Bacillus sp. (in: Bacteria)]|nr:pirin family protein [Bacillus sp. (in: firmicutes)]
MTNGNNNKVFQREVKDHWKVTYEEGTFPFIQKGWILPPGSYEDFDPFILMAEDWFKRGAFADHPHRGFQTITYVVDGRLEHIDNGGNRDILEPGDVQYMNAGWAARHGEEGVEDDIAHTLQLWLNLPKKLKITETSYQNVYSENTPVVPFPGGSIKVFSGEVAGVTGPLQSLVPITLTEICLGVGVEYILELPENHNAFLYVLGGNVEVGATKVDLTKHHVSTLTFHEKGEESKQSRLVLRGKHRRTKLLVYSGVPIREEIVQHGPFVMNTKEEINEAYRDYHAGVFGPPAK